jgi:hypothetical protein
MTAVVLHDGRRFELAEHPCHRDEVELVLEAPDGSSAGVAEVHLEPHRRADVVLAIRPGPSATEAGTVLLAEAAELAARRGALELHAPHVDGDADATTMLEGIGLASRDRRGVGGPTAVIDLRPLVEWRELAPA